MDKQRNFISKQSILFYVIVFIIALVAGTFFNLILNDKDTKLVIDHLTNFFTLVKSDNINYLPTFINTFLLNILYIFVIWILGFTVIAIPIIMIIYFFKSFIVGFTISSLISYFKIKGILYSFIYLFPHTIVHLLLILILSTISIFMSLRIIDILRKKKKNFNILLKKYFIILIIFIFITFITSIYEVLLLPKVFNLLI